MSQESFAVTSSQRRRLWRLAAIVSFSVAVGAACSEATDGLVPPPIEGASDASVEGSSSSSSSSSSGSTADANTVVLINEISGDKEWVELVNSGGDAVDVSGWKIADRDKTTGGPKLSEAAELPAGTTLPSGAYGLVLGGGLDAGKDCPSGGQVFCAHAEFGISTKNGETIFLLDGAERVLGSVVFPPDASGPDQSWSRRPNADPNGAFSLAPATPGAPNN